MLHTIVAVWSGKYKLVTFIPILTIVFTFKCYVRFLPSSL